MGISLVLTTGCQGRELRATQRMPSTVTNVSVIIVSWNTRGVLRDCLQSIYSQHEDLSLEVIVCDNDSQDGTQSMVRDEFPQVVLVENGSNLGFAAANNIGIRRARGQYVLLLNPDTVVHAGAIGTVYSFAKRHERAAVVGCRTLNGDGTLQRNCFLPPGVLNIAITILGLHRLFPRSRFFGRERMTFWDLDDEREVAAVAGCFMLVRREAAAEIGVLDDRFFMYAEEVDWCVRFRIGGWQVWYTPDATITHYGGVSAAIVPTQMREQMQRSLLLFLRKYHSRPYVLACRMLMIFGLVFRAVVDVTKLSSLRSPNDFMVRLGQYCRMLAVHIRGS